MIPLEHLSFLSSILGKRSVCTDRTRKAPFPQRKSYT